jgi:hypothetical protein
MNERIKELAKQSNLQDGWFCGQGNIAKFAHLLLNECARKLEDDGMVEVAIELKQHFGVEE